jgi:hypothetical protein
MAKTGGVHMKIAAWSMVVAVFLIVGMVSVLASPKATPTPPTAKIVREVLGGKCGHVR